MKSILSRDFKYVPSAQTDIRKTFAKVRKQLADQQRKQDNVMPIKQRSKQ